MIEMDDEFDDPVLQRALHGAASTNLDVDAAFSTFVRRARVARRRRTAGWVASVGVLAVLLVAAASALPGSNDQRLVPANSTDGTSVDRDGSSTPSVPSPTEVTGATDPSASTVPSMTAADDTVATAPPQSTPTGTVATAGGTGATVPSGSTGSAGSTTPTDPPATATVSKTCTSAGGSLTVKVSAGTMTVVAATPAGGWQLHEVEQEGPGTRKATFENADDDRWRVTATWNGSGITCSTRFDPDSSGSGSDDSSDDSGDDDSDD
jgi:hypothetical protein